MGWVAELERAYCSKERRVTELEKFLMRLLNNNDLGADVGLNVQYEIRELLGLRHLRSEP